MIWKALHWIHHGPHALAEAHSAGEDGWWMPGRRVTAKVTANMTLRSF